MKTFTINGKEYEEKEITFNTMCDFEEAGVSMTDISEKTLMVMRAYVAMCMGVSAKEAGKEINAHVMNGGDMAEIYNAFSEASENSDFLHSMSPKKAPETEAPKKLKAVK